MPKVKPSTIAKKERQKIINNLFDIVAELEDKKEIVDFFAGMITASEALMFARRMQIAKMLLSKNTYNIIVKRLGVGKNTIAKVDQWLFERNESYRKILEKTTTKINTKKKA